MNNSLRSFLQNEAKHGNFTMEEILEYGVDRYIDNEKLTKFYDEHESDVWEVAKEAAYIYDIYHIPYRCSIPSDAERLRENLTPPIWFLIAHTETNLLIENHEKKRIYNGISNLSDLKKHLIMFTFEHIAYHIHEGTFDDCSDESETAGNNSHNDGSNEVDTNGYDGGNEMDADNNDSYLAESD